MIYCDIKEKENGSAVYYFGVSLVNITGEARFFSNPQTPEILQQPNGESVPIEFLAKIVAKYYEKFAMGDFPEKLSYER